MINSSGYNLVLSPLHFYTSESIPFYNSTDDIQYVTESKRVLLTARQAIKLRDSSLGQVPRDGPLCISLAHRQHPFRDELVARAIEDKG